MCNNGSGIRRKTGGYGRLASPCTPAGILPRKERSLHGRNDDDAKNGPPAPFALEATRRGRAFFFACPLPRARRMAGWSLSTARPRELAPPARIWPRAFSKKRRLCFRGFGDTKPDVVVLVRRVVVVPVRCVQVVVVVVERPAPQAAIRPVVVSRSPVYSLVAAQVRRCAGRSSGRAARERPRPAPVSSGRPGCAACD